MRIVIIGAGDAGRRLAERVCGERHDVVLIDKSIEPLEDTAATLDVQIVHGSGTSPEVLAEAGVAKAGLVAAVTDQDEVNILAAMFASHAGATHTAVRVSNDELTTPDRLEYFAELGIDLVVNEHEESAREVLSVLNLGGTRESAQLANGRIHAVGIDLPAESPLLSGSLKSFPHTDLLKTVRMIAVMRHEKLLMPHGNITFEEDDTIYCVGEPHDVQRFLETVRPDNRIIDRVIIAGAGETGFRIAHQLEKQGHNAVIIESDSVRAHDCSAMLEKSTIISGNALDPTVLEDIGITPTTATVAATGDDENNIIASLLGKKLGAALGIALISKAEYVPIINEAHLLDRAVSPYLTTINAIFRFLRGTNIHSTTLLQNVPGELLEIHLPQSSKWNGKALKDMRLPRRAIVAAVLREQDTIIPTGETVLQTEDDLIIFAPLGSAAKLESVFRK